LEQKGKTPEEELIVTDPYSLFVYAIRSPVRKKKYESRLCKFFDFMNLLQESSMQERCKEFVIKGSDDAAWVSNNILKFIQIQKQRLEQKQISGATIRNYLKAIKLFCKMSERLVPWKKIHNGLTKGIRHANDRAPTMEEIRNILEYADRRLEAIVYTMVSSGIRLGAWDYLLWKHIKSIKRNGRIVAAKAITQSMKKFIPPEAYNTLEEWIKYREKSAEIISPNSWLMRNLWEVTKPGGFGLVTGPQKMKSSGIKILYKVS
jgi:integrase